MGRNTGTHQLLRQLRADGVTCLFGNPGTSEQNILDARRGDEFRDLRYYLGSHEGSTVAMADAYARVTQRPAIVQLHSYAGLANGLGMLKYAHRGYTPMVVLAGEAGLRYEALDGQMAADLVSIARPVVKSDHNGPCAWRAVDPGSVVRLVRARVQDRHDTAGRTSIPRSADGRAGCREPRNDCANLADTKRGRSSA